MEKHLHIVRRGIFLNLSLFQFITFVRRGVFYTFMINYLFDLMQTAVTYTTLLGTFNMLSSALGQNLIWGKIADKYKLRTKLVIMGESIAAVAYLLVYIVHKSLLDAQANFAAGLSLIFGLSLLEFFWSISDVGWAALLTDVTTAKTRGRAVGSLNFIASVGRMVGISFAGFLYMGGEGFRQGTIFYVVIVMLVTTTMIMWITSRSIKEAPLKKEETTTKTTHSTSKTIDDSTKIYKWFLVSLVIIVVGMACISQVFLLFLPLENGLNASDPQMSFILTAWTLGGMLASLSSGWLADRFGRVRMLFTGFALGILTPLLYAAASTFEAMALVYGLNGVGFWITQTVGFAFAGDLIPEDKRGRLLSRYNAVMALSWGPAGLFVGGPLADFQTRSLGIPTYMAYANTFYASAAIVTVGTLLFAAKVATSKTREVKL